MQQFTCFLAAKRSAAAKRAVYKVRFNVNILARQPSIGRSVEDMPEAFREWMISFRNSGYVARYHIDGSGVTILAIRHQKEVGS